MGEGPEGMAGTIGAALGSVHEWAGGGAGASLFCRTTWEARSGLGADNGTMVGRVLPEVVSMRTGGAGRAVRLVHTGAGIARAMTRSAVWRSPILRSTRATKRHISGYGGIPP